MKPIQSPTCAHHHHLVYQLCVSFVATDSPFVIESLDVCGPFLNHHIFCRVKQERKCLPHNRMNWRLQFFTLAERFICVYLIKYCWNKNVKSRFLWQERRNFGRLWRWHVACIISHTYGLRFWSCDYNMLSEARHCQPLSLSLQVALRIPCALFCLRMYMLAWASRAKVRVDALQNYLQKLLCTFRI